jgi:NADPH-dependent 2,4-dienoyl-CoA reductase/sulfur reductase-like enzyme/nitrite reductase/ring-hydroxylating ferredoxin subunit
MGTKRVAAHVDELKDGEMKMVRIEHHQVVLVRIGEAIHALSARCPHQGAPLSEGLLCGTHIICPWHQARFDSETGHVKEPPALDALAHLRVEVRGKDLLVELPEKLHHVPSMSSYNPDADQRAFFIIGTGAAGSAAAEMLRQQGFEGRIVMVTKDRHIPYDRTMLSKAFLRSSEMDLEKTYLRKAPFYEEHGIELLLGKTVVDMDPLQKRILYEDNGSDAYDALLLAPGGTAVRPKFRGGDLENIFVLRTLEDAYSLDAAIKDASRAVVVGASFIGMEVASELTTRGLAVTIIDPMEVPFESNFGKKIGRRIQQLHEEKGVSFRMEKKLQGFQGEGKVAAAVLEGEEAVTCDLAVVGIGMKPATAFLKRLELAPGGGVKVDKKLRAGEDIYVAGDSATFPDRHTGEMIRIEHWRLAQQQGRLAALNMLGEDRDFDALSFFWTDQFETTFQYVGHATDWDDVLIQGDLSQLRFLAYYVKGDHVLAALGCNQEMEMAMVAEMMERRQMPHPDKLKDPSYDLVACFSNR